MRRNSLFWGVIILVAGVLMLLINWGILPGNFWQVFWPVLLILLGVWFLVGPYLFRKDMLKEETVEIPLQADTFADIRVAHGAGELNITGSARPGMLVDGTAVGGAEVELERKPDRTKVKLRANNDFFFGITPANFHGLNWNLGLTTEIPLRLKLETGASSTEITMPAAAGATQAEIKCGAAGVKIQVPGGVAARIRIKSGMAGIMVDPARFPAVMGGYESPDFATAANKIDLNVETGMGSIEIR